jgi:hypothetical protein
MIVKKIIIILTANFCAVLIYNDDVSAGGVTPLLVKMRALDKINPRNFDSINCDIWL